MNRKHLTVKQDIIIIVIVSIIIIIIIIIITVIEEWRRVAFVRNDDSGELSASIIRVTRIGELET
jgi:hypothetical protein